MASLATERILALAKVKVGPRHPHPLAVPLGFSELSLRARGHTGLTGNSCKGQKPPCSWLQNRVVRGLGTAKRRDKMGAEKDRGHSLKLLWQLGAAALTTMIEVGALGPEALVTPGQTSLWQTGRQPQTACGSCTLLGKLSSSGNRHARSGWCSLEGEGDNSLYSAGLHLPRSWLLSPALMGHSCTRAGA